MAVSFQQISELTYHAMKPSREKKIIEELRRNHDIEEIKRELEREEQEERRQRENKAYLRFSQMMQEDLARYYEKDLFSLKPRIIQQVEDDSQDVDFSE